jgi:homoserine kinase
VTLVRSTDPIDIISIPSPEMYITVIHPQIEIKTSEARRLLPELVPLKNAVKQWSNVGALVAGFFKNDLDMISRSLEDIIVEPVRKKLIPGFDEIKKRSMEKGALGGGISGSGPSLFMLSRDRSTALEIEAVMKDVYADKEIAFFTYVTTLNHKGCILQENIQHALL